MNENIILNFAPLLLEVPYEESKLTTAINQIENEGTIFFGVSFYIENEGAGAFELEIENKEDYENGSSPVWSIWDKELGEIYKSLINSIGKQIEIHFKRLV